MKRQTKCRGEYLERCRGLGEDVSAVLFGFGRGRGRAAAQRAVSQRRVVLGCASPRRYVGANQMKRGAEEVNKETELIMT